MIHAEFVSNLIGCDWREGSQGPDEFDCWGLARFVQREMFGRELPLAGISAEQVNDLRAVMRAIDSHPVRAEWIEAAGTPRHGDLVTMAHHLYASHIGVYLKCDAGGVLHCVRDGGVMFDPLPVLTLKGFARLRFYRHASCSDAGISPSVAQPGRARSSSVEDAGSNPAGGDPLAR